MTAIIVGMILLAMPAATWILEARDNSRSVECWRLIREARENERERILRNHMRVTRYASIGRR